MARSSLREGRLSLVGATVRPHLPISLCDPNTEPHHFPSGTGDSMWCGSFSEQNNQVDLDSA